MKNYPHGCGVKPKAAIRTVWFQQFCKRKQKQQINNLQMALSAEELQIAPFIIESLMGKSWIAQLGEYIQRLYFVRNLMFTKGISDKLWGPITMNPCG